MSGRAIEAAGDIDTLLLDKTGTITYGNRMASELIPGKGIAELELARAALAASLPDDTPEGKSIVLFAKNQYAIGGAKDPENDGVFVPFTAKTRMSGIDIPGQDGLPDPQKSIRKGSMEAMEERILSLGGHFPEDVKKTCEKIARSGGTPLVVSVGKTALGVIHLKDVIKEGIRERFAGLHAMGIRTS